MPDSAAVTTDPLHMVQLTLDAQGLAVLGRMLSLPLARTPTNYLVHCALGELFQDQAPHPFSVESEQGRHVRVLGYSSVDRETLQSLAQAFASPTVYEICDWGEAASKPMPDVFPKGMRLAFETRVCPVVRKASGGARWKAGQELDAFLSKVWAIDDRSVDIEREEVYTEWLRGHLTRGGADAQRIGLERFSIERMLRRTQGRDRKAKTIQRPDATLSGTLQITDSTDFAHLLRRGIGRHRSFGYGMLKLRRA